MMDFKSSISTVYVFLPRKLRFRVLHHVAAITGPVGLMDPMDRSRGSNAYW